MQPPVKEAIPTIVPPKKKLNKFERLIQVYDERLEEYKLCKFTVRVKNYLELIPRVSRSISNMLKEFIHGRFKTLAPGFDVCKKV